MLPYDKDYVHQVSVNFPLSFKAYKGQSIKAFFSGLLSDENVRHRLVNHLGLSERNASALLESAGGDYAGALSLYLHGQVPHLPTDDTETP
ncbi:HipA N-terminal domain-containing protein [Bartonella koehlerae]|uniref:HipA domain-containing protein n=1 Tax=Bartonella koehlerae C-29 TaxID=1134510 RepID=A0A067WF39_9HYPH|nr:HipA N-terminal domain-containing protein [Bartonella koehlerae]KEC54502.1 HipA domain-containing protein [Bartonella koehlerae C-29]